MKIYLPLLLALLWATAACKNNAAEEKPEDKGLLSTDLVSNPHSAAGLDTARYNNEPTMDFSDTTHNFGDIAEGVTVEHSFSFKNNGKTPLIVSSAKGSCGCTVADYPNEPVSPGGEGVIKVVFNSTDKMGHVEKSVALTTNSQRSVHMLYIKADVADKK